MPITKTQIAREDDTKIHEQFVEYGTNAKAWARKCALLLPEIEKREIWRKKKFGSIYEYAAKIAGMSHYQVTEALRITKKIEDKPMLRMIAEEKGLGILRPIATVITKENEKFWADKARDMTVREMEAYVRSAKFQGGTGNRRGFGNYRGRNSDPCGTCVGSGNRIEDRGLHVQSVQPVKTSKTVKIEMELEVDVAMELQKLKASGGDWNRLMKVFLEMRRGIVEEGKPSTVRSGSRHIPARIKSHVSTRTDGICAFPGCTKKAETFHHIDRFALFGEHDPDRITFLCAGHHSLVHDGFVYGESDSLPVEKWQVRNSAMLEGLHREIDIATIRYKNRGRRLLV